MITTNGIGVKEDGYILCIETRSRNEGGGNREVWSPTAGNLHSEAMYG
jgi:hypothetical protein